jgi:thiol-disulfide isomerase/thioredoxin
MMMKKLSQVKAFYDTIETNETVVTVWKTRFCPDCIILNPFLPSIEAMFEDAVFVEIDRNKMIDLSKHLEVYGIPSFILFKKGKEVARLVNKNRKTKAEVIEFIEQNI